MGWQVDLGVLHHLGSGLVRPKDAESIGGASFKNSDITLILFSLDSFDTRCRSVFQQLPMTLLKALGVLIRHTHKYM